MAAFGAVGGDFRTARASGQHFDYVPAGFLASASNLFKAPSQS
jgi:hypothetical protein